MSRAMPGPSFEAATVARQRPSRFPGRSKVSSDLAPTFCLLTAMSTPELVGAAGGAMKSANAERPLDGEGVLGES